MFDTNATDGVLVEQVDPLNPAQQRSEESSGLTTEFVDNNNLLSKKEVRDAYKRWTDDRCLGEHQPDLQKGGV